jgi:hypothetical protein
MMATEKTRTAKSAVRATRFALVKECGQVFSRAGSLHPVLQAVDDALVASASGVNALFAVSAMAERTAENEIQGLRDG